MTTKIKLFSRLSCVLFGLATVLGQGAAQEKAQIMWQDGPTVGQLGNVAQLRVPQGYRFSGKDGALKLLELTQNPSDGNELGVVIPDVQDSKNFWYAIFEFNDTGYVRDDEKSNLDQAAILQSIQSATEDSNKTRQANGWPAFHVAGWTKPPFYNPLTNNLTWAITGYSLDPKSGREDAVNYSVRILGRRGAMSAELIVTPDQAETAMPEFESLLTGFSFVPGQTYADFRSGDKVAKYGLTGLILGGAVVAAAKTGLLAKFWKLIVILFLGIISTLKKLLRYLKRLFTGKASEEEPAGQG